MTLFSPALAFGFVIASIYGLVFFIIFSRGWSRLLLYWFTGVAGFALGQWFSTAVALSFLTIGSVNLIEGTFAAWVALFAVRAVERSV